MLESPAYVPHREQLGAQLEWLSKDGHTAKDGESLPDFLARLDTEEVITLLSREASQDATTLRSALQKAEETGRLLVREPRASLAPRRVTLESVEADARPFTLTRAQAQDPRRYAAAKAASIKGGHGPIPTIISG